MKLIQAALLILALLVINLSIGSIAHAQGVAMVRLVHALPDAPSVALYANGKQIGDPLNFSEIGNYVILKPGKYQFQAVPAGREINTAPAVEATVAAGAFYTVAAAGLLPSVKPTIFVDDPRTPAPAQASVRVYHLSPDAPAIDLMVKDGAKLVYNLPFPGASNYFTVGIDQYHLQVLPATVKSPVLADLPDTDLEAGKITNIFIIGPLVALKTEVTQTLPNMPARLPDTGGAALPLTAVTSLALLLLACGIALRRSTQH